MRTLALFVSAVAILAAGCVPKPTAADAENVVREVLAEVNCCSAREVVMDRPIERPPLDSDTDDMMLALSMIQRKFRVTISDAAVKQVVGVEDIDEAPSRLTGDHIVRLVKLALYEQNQKK